MMTDMATFFLLLLLSLVKVASAQSTTTKDGNCADSLIYKKLSEMEVTIQQQAAAMEKMEMKIQAKDKYDIPCHQKIEGVCYYISVGTATWEQALINCQDLYGGTLAIVDTPKLWNNLKLLVHNKGHVWIGGVTFNKGASYQWYATGQTIVRRPHQSSLWSDGQPDGGNEDCVHMRSGAHKFNDISCSSQFLYLCQV